MDINDHGAGATRPAEIPISIDKKPYKGPKPDMTGTEIRQLPQPPIGPERDLWQVIPGPDPDLKIAADRVVTLKPGDHFFTAPTKINPGARGHR